MTALVRGVFEPFLALLSHPLGTMGAMERQLVLIEAPPREWRLDEHTREVGRRGFESARAALAHATRPDHEHNDHDHNDRGQSTAA
ncbi:hypothetical protein BH24ACT3_BH24ACT3_08210 [soil metagenome]